MPFLIKDPIIKGSKSFETERDGKNRAANSPVEGDCEIEKSNYVHDGKDREDAEASKRYSYPHPLVLFWVESSLGRGFLVRGAQAVMGLIPQGEEMRSHIKLLCGCYRRPGKVGVSW